MADLEMKDVTKKYGDKLAVNHVCMHVGKGQFVAFLGPNGAGKSTTVAMLTGLIEPSSGTIKLGQLTPSTKAYHSKIGVVFQNSVLDKNLTVLRNLQIKAKMYAVVSMEWVLLLAEKFGLQNFLHQKYGTLSGGQRRRADIVRALIKKPEVLILDEPSTGLDIQTRTVIWHTLKDLQKNMDLTILLTTHYLEEAESADYIYIIDHGKIIAADAIAQLKQKYARYHLSLTSSDPKQLAEQLRTAHYEFREEDHLLCLEIKDALQCIALLHQYQSEITAFECRQNDMNDIFIELTGKEIR